jgi:hypothetical protein
MRVVSKHSCSPYRCCSLSQKESPLVRELLCTSPLQAHPIQWDGFLTSNLSVLFSQLFLHAAHIASDSFHTQQTN